MSTKTTSRPDSAALATAASFSMLGKTTSKGGNSIRNGRRSPKARRSLERQFRVGIRPGEKTTAQTTTQSLEGIPFAYIIYQKSYTNPVVTKCKHYSCESCALQRYRKTPSCAACGVGTAGVFNGAKSLRKLLDKKRERAKKKKEKAIEDGGEVSEDKDQGEKSDD